MKSLRQAILFVFPLLLAGSLSAQEPTIAPSRLPNLIVSSYGNCIAGETAIEIAAMRTFKEDTFIYNFGSKRTIVLIEGDSLDYFDADEQTDISAENLTKPDEYYFFHPVEYLASTVSNQERMDISLHFAHLKGETYIYWRETYQNRSYRQGLLSFDGSEFENYCTGSAGSSTRH